MGKDDKIIVIKSIQEANDLNSKKLFKDIVFKDSNLVEKNVLSTSPIYLNDVLVRHPFEEDKYLKIEEAEILIIKSKLNIIKELCSSLGATNIKSSVHILETKTLNQKATVEGESRYVHTTIKANLLESQINKYEQEIVDESEFIRPEGFSLKETYPAALEIAEKYHLRNDLDLNSLLVLLNPDKKGSVLKRQIVKFKASNEINNLFELAAELNSKGITLSPNFSKTIEQINILQITLDITF